MADDASEGGAIMTLTQAITELAALANGRTRWIDMECGCYSTGTVKLEWTITVEAEPKNERWTAPTLDEAMTAARSALRPVAVRDAVAAADGAMAG